MQAHLLTCNNCREELDNLHSVIETFAHWPTDLLRPVPALWQRLVARIANDTGKPSAVSPATRSAEPDWQEAAPGITYKVLATDAANDRVSMLVRLATGVAYPPHRHAGIEELHLLSGELWIDDRKLYPGDYNRSEPGTADRRVWSETGCTCLLITSPSDVLS